MARKQVLDLAHVLWLLEKVLGVDFYLGEQGERCVDVLKVVIVIWRQGRVDERTDLVADDFKVSGGV